LPSRTVFIRIIFPSWKKKAKKLPIKDDDRIAKLITDLNNIKQGNSSENVIGFDETYKSKIKSITTKVVALNRTRF